jgi:hypothetical protein
MMIATEQDQLIVYLYPYLAGIAALYES